MNAPAVGSLWKHWKGGLYLVDGTAVHTESGERLVIYHRLAQKETHARPLEQWEQVMPSGERRFRLHG